MEKGALSLRGSIALKRCHSRIEVVRVIDQRDRIKAV